MKEKKKAVSIIKGQTGRFQRMDDDQIEAYEEPGNYEQEQQEELLNIQLEEYDYLTKQIYEDDEGNRRQVISIRYDNRRKTYCTLARAVNEKNEWIRDIQYEKREIEGQDGTIQKIEERMPGRRELEETLLPTKYEEWLKVQKEDPSLNILLNNLVDGKAIDLAKFKDSLEEDYAGIDVHRSRAKKHGSTFDVMYRRTIPIEEDEGVEIGTQGPERLGPLVRRFTRTKTVTHGGVTISKTEEVEQIVIPDDLIRKIIYIGHNKFGHQGNNRTLTSLKQRFYWPTMRRDVQTYVKNCHYCNCRKAENSVINV
jgi:hypothetical protein